MPTLTLVPGLAADSVFVFEKQWYQPERVDSTRVRLYVSAALNLVVKKEKVDVAGRVIEQEFLIALQSK